MGSRLMCSTRHVKNYASFGKDVEKVNSAFYTRCCTQRHFRIVAYPPPGTVSGVPSSSLVLGTTTEIWPGGVVRFSSLHWSREEKHPWVRRLGPEKNFSTPLSLSLSLSFPEIYSCSYTWVDVGILMKYCIHREGAPKGARGGRKRTKVSPREKGDLRALVLQLPRLQESAINMFSACLAHLPRLIILSYSFNCKC